jgi:hypothetical protein
MVSIAICSLPFAVYTIAFHESVSIIRAFTVEQRLAQNNGLHRKFRRINQPVESLKREQALLHESSKEQSQNGGLGYRFGDITRSLVDHLNDKASELTGKEKYEFGDISRWIDRRAKEHISNIKSEGGEYTYEFGDISRLVDDLVKEQAAKYSGKETASDYQFGDVSKTIVKKILTGEYDPQDIYLAFRILVVSGCSLLPIAQVLPLNTMIELFELGLVRDIGFRLLPMMATSIDSRMKEALTGNSHYQLGDITKERLRQHLVGFTGNEKYEFGDITRAVMKRQRNNKSIKEVAIGVNSNSLAIDNTEIFDELLAWDRRFLENIHNSTVSGS